MMGFSFYTFDQLDAATLYEIIAHRMEVFVLGQGNIYRDLDGFDQKATHLLARDEAGALVGYVRLLPAALHYDGHDHNSFGRLSVKDAARGKGLGAELVRLACRRLAQDSGDPVVEISAMAYLEDFYRRLGFERISEEYTIAGVPHVNMLFRG